MPGLIPLMLGNRASWLPPPPTTSPTSQTAPKLRRQSTQNTDTWQSYQSKRPKPVKRFSLPAPAPLPIIPYSSAEWKKAIAEIKRQHMDKRYRACSARCVDIINGIKDKSQVEPVYLIYLHFYAATSLEILARPLPSSSHRTDLLHQARNHFNRASALINAAEESVVSKVRSSSSMSSRGSSCHSPASSISSRAWTPETPIESVSSCEDLSSRDNSPKRVKKVSFSLPKEEPIQMKIPEPMIRPDSPTLGFDDFYFSSPVLQQRLPDLPVSPKFQDRFQEVEYPLHTIHESEDEHESPSSPSETSEEDDESAYMISQTIDRCCEHLSGLRRQLNRHSANLDQWLRSPPSPIIPPAVRARLNSAAEELRALDKQARIERLRKINWERERFDPRRYEELCEEVMAELS
ncbi:hypothetical protein QBC40DRAFT_18722 [Triangularia verruculosa]|uniref:Uncharacterized protein n=1 Tax=Triangularia verruculosa TaxID=2587418 RepID=A0AAN6XD99_9PEZI|nr:hypothetical protein QBC40DRAFT_18722 [Triangularia verruculosa]